MTDSRTQLLRLLGAGALLLASTGSLAPAHSADVAVEFRVDSTRDQVDANPGDGACRTAAGTCTLRAAVQEANAVPGRQSIQLPAGRFNLSLKPLTGNGEFVEFDAGRGDLDLNDPVDLHGAGAQRTVIDARGIDRVFSNLVTNSASMRDLTVRGGRAGTSLGGGIWNQGYLVLDRVAVLDNWADTGGGIFNIPRAHMVLRDSLVAGNRAGEGGGIRVDGGSEIINSTISGNSLFPADPDAQPSEPTGYGGGIDHKAVGDLTIINSTIVGNRAVYGGGGLNSTSGYTPIEGEPELARVRLVNSVFADNRSLRGTRDCRRAGGIVLESSHVLDSDGSCGTSGATNLPHRRARLGPLMDNGGPTWTHLPWRRSPLLDKAAPQGCPALDQRGFGRPRARCDIGAVERKARDGKRAGPVAG